MTYPCVVLSSILCMTSCPVLSPAYQVLVEAEDCGPLALRRQPEETPQLGAARWTQRQDPAHFKHNIHLVIHLVTE